MIYRFYESMVGLWRSTQTSPREIHPWLAILTQIYTSKINQYYPPSTLKIYFAINCLFQPRKKDISILSLWCTISLLWYYIIKHSLSVWYYYHNHLNTIQHGIWRKGKLEIINLQIFRKLHFHNLYWLPKPHKPLNQCN